LFEAVSGQVGFGEDIVFISTRETPVVGQLEEAAADAAGQRPILRGGVRELRPDAREFRELFLVQ
jgi:hypothetical protein